MAVKSITTQNLAYRKWSKTEEVGFIILFCKSGFVCLSFVVLLNATLRHKDRTLEREIAV
jgi:hypothetical protein